MAEADTAKEFAEANKSTDSIKCDGCGANMVFDPQTQMLKCESCGRTESFSKDLNVKELDIEQAFSKGEKWGAETSVFNCENCGGRVVLEKNDFAQRCPFCGTSHVVKVDQLAGLKPNALIPFTVTHDGALDCYKKWVKGRLLAPSDFKKNISPDRVSGVYTPCFTFDSCTYSKYVGRVGKRHTRTSRDSKGNTHTETYIVWKNISGVFNNFFDDVTINSSESFDQNKIDKIMPFRTDTACVYEDKFLSGYMAGYYTKDIKACWSDAKNVMDKRIRSMILSKYDHDVVDYLNVKTTHEKVTYKYVLLPVYLGSYSYKSKVYQVYINGSTGKVIGKSPVSPIKASLLGVAIAIVASAVIYLIYKIYVNS